MINQLENNDIKTFIFAGKAIFTITNTNTGNRFTYRVRKAKDNDIYFVSVLTGSDNTSSYSFIGYIKKGFLTIFCILSQFLKKVYPFLFLIIKV